MGSTDDHRWEAQMIADRKQMITDISAHLQTYSFK